MFADGFGSKILLSLPGRKVGCKARSWGHCPGQQEATSKADANVNRREVEFGKYYISTTRCLQWKIKNSSWREEVTDMKGEIQIQ